MTSRRLAAILVADVVGFSSLMGQDEEGTLARIKSLRREVIVPKVQEHHGRVFKTTGDGLLVEFASPVEAVRCAVAVQEALAAQGSQEPPQALQLRIGINLGDIIIEEDGDVYGDGVNIAARLEQLAEPGGVSISGKVYEEVRDKLPYAFEDRGQQQVKNIARPVRVYALRGPKPTVTPKELKALSLLDRPSIVVLPFTNMSGDPEQIYFSDGLSEDVITELSRFRELWVIARNSSFSFRGQSVDVREIGRLLGANYVVEGSVRRLGNRVRITAQLVNALSGAHLWAERFDRAVEDVFAIQEEIAGSIVATVSKRVREEDEMVARRRQPENLRAYDLFLQGLHLSDTLTPEAQSRAEALFEQARKLDPTFARAYTGLAFVHVFRWLASGMLPVRNQDEHRQTALRLAEEALALDPNDPRVHMTAGFVCEFLREFDRAERHMDAAKAMNPNDPWILIRWASLQGSLGRAELGLSAAEMAFRLNPRHPRVYEAALARLLFQLERYAEAAPLLEERTSASPSVHLRDVAWRAATYGHLGRIAQAQDYARTFVEAAEPLWRGGPGAGPKEYVDWVVDVSLMRRTEDEERLRNGLRRAGLPA